METNVQNVTNVEGQVVESTAETQVADNQETAKTYTEKEVMDMLQRETDRRVTAALEQQQRKNEAKIAEAQKLAEMNESEKFQYKLEQREKAIEEKERALAMMENKNEASKILSERGISLSLVDFVVAEDADTMKANIDLLDRAFKSSVKAEVEKLIGSSAPRKNAPVDKQMTKADFSKLSYTEMLQLKQSDPALYNELSQ